MYLWQLKFFVLIIIVKFCNAQKFCDGAPDGHVFPHLNECNKYFFCSGEIPHLLECPDGFLFNAENLKCDYPENVQCHQKIFRQKRDEPTEAEMYCPPEDDPTNLIFYPSIIRCDWYYLCSGGRPYKLTCAPGYHWNQQKFQCDIPANANCQIDDPSSTLATSSTTSSSTATSSSTHKPTASSSTSTQTMTSTTMMPTSPSSTISTTTTTEWISTSSSEPETTTDHNGVSCPQSGTHYFSHATNCQYFIFCRDGFSSLQRCMLGFKFDKFDQFCVSYKEARC